MSDGLYEPDYDAQDAASDAGKAVAVYARECSTLRAEVARLRDALANVTAVAKAEDARNCMSCTSTAVILAALQETRHE